MVLKARDALLFLRHEFLQMRDSDIFKKTANYNTQF